MEGFTRGNLNPYWHSIDTLVRGPVAPQNASAGAAWPTANLAIYVPLMVRVPVVVKQLWFGGTSTATGNYDIGLYAADGTALLRRGSTAKAASTSEIVWDCTDTRIERGIYYFALVSDTSTDSFQRLSLTAPYPASLGIWSEASAFPLPATATFACDSTLAYVPVGGLLLSTVVT